MTTAFYNASICSASILESRHSGSC